MDWIVIAALLVWVVVLQRRLDAVAARLRGVEDAVRRADPTIDTAIETPAPVRPATPVRAAGSGPLWPVAGVSAAVEEAARAAEPVGRAAPAAPSPAGPSIARTAPPPASAPSMGLAGWLSENGLAWLGGGALVLGGVFLVAYAAQQGLFTPAARISAAVVLGLAMITAGEVVRRGLAPVARHPLAAGVVSGAGAATLYAAIWAAYALYGFLRPIPAGLALACVSASLFGLAILHGEALALLAVLGAYLAPAVCAPERWSGVGLDAYLAVITVTGLIVVSLRAWTMAGLLVLTAAGLWIVDRTLMRDVAGAAGLLVASAALSVIAASIARATAAGAGATRLGRLPVVAVAGGSALWAILVALGPRTPAAVSTLEGAGVMLAAGAAVRLDLMRPRVLFAPAAALALAALARRYLGAGTAGAEALLWVLPPAALAMAGFTRSLAGDHRREAAGAGAGGAAVGLTLLQPLLAAGAGPRLAFLVFVATGAAFLAAGEAVARRAPDRRGDLATAAWIAAGAESLGLAVHTGLAGLAEPAACAGLALLLALAAWRRPTRGLAESAAVAALVALFAALGPAISAAVWTGTLDAPGLLTALVPAVLLQVMTWAVLKRASTTPHAAEAVSTVAVATGLLAAFLGLRALVARTGGAPGLDPFVEAALRTDLLAAAGLGLTVRSGPSRLSRLRGPVLLALAVVHGAVLGGLLLNPWWGLAGSSTPLAGPPIIDSLALAFLAPALMFAAAAYRLRRDAPAGAALLAGSALAAAWLWIMLEIRRLTHGVDLRMGATGHGEACAYGASILALALAIAWLDGRRTRHPAPPATVAPLGTSLAGVAQWACLIIGAVVVGYTASPWWGPLRGPLRDPVLLFASLSLGAALVGGLAAGSWVRDRALAAASRATCSLIVLVLITLAIRFAFHGAAMRTPLAEASAETWTYSAAWAALGLAILVAGARWHDRTIRWSGLALLLGTTAKVFLFDMAMLQGVVRAGSFLALGVLLLCGALAARRLRA